MLKIDIAELEFYDSEKEMFIYTKPLTVRLEHSLISISKWEAIWESPFFPVKGIVDGMTGYDQEISYISCMIIGEVPDYIPTILIQNHRNEIREHIEKKHTATTINRRGPKQSFVKSVITSELIYYWMIKFNIPIECERWHFNRLIMLIDVCNIKESSGTKSGKLSTRQANEYMMKLNKARQGG